MSNISDIFMRRALSLAERGLGSVSTNPMVGAVVVSAEGRVIGEGYHKRYGEAHAEVNAIRSVRDSDRELLPYSTLYVTLEPCCHYGKTPPCTKLIIDSKIPRVVVAMRDPFAKVNGEGIKQLIDAGVEVIEGMLQSKAQELNRRFITYHTLMRPYIILKWAESSDGFIDTSRSADEPPVWLTGQIAKTLVHRWRHEEDAIMVGANTVIRDNPSLTVRLWQGDNPTRVTIDCKGSLDCSAEIFNNEAPTILYNHDNLPLILSDLHSKGIQSIIIEGGSKLLSCFIRQELYDEVRRFIAPATISSYDGNIGGVKAPVVSNLKHTTKYNIGAITLEVGTK